MMMSSRAVCVLLVFSLCSCVLEGGQPYPPADPDPSLDAYKDNSICNLRGPPIDCSDHAKLSRGLFGVLELHSPACAQVTVVTWKKKDDDPEHPWTRAEKGERQPGHPVPHDAILFTMPPETLTVAGGDATGDVAVCVQFPAMSWSLADKRHAMDVTTYECKEAGWACKEMSGH